MARKGEVQMLMKGSLHTDELMSAVVSREGGMRTGRRISHVFALDVPSYHKTLFVTDAAVNIRPDIETKIDILQNAIDMMHTLEIANPKVAILSAVESVNPAIPSTLDAAALCKMVDRGQITGAIVDGPLAFDNAISSEAARIKKINSPVAGDPDLLMVPNLEAGNILFKELQYLAGALAAGVVVGAKVPIVLTSRADGELARMASCALGVLLAKPATDWKSKAKPQNAVSWVIPRRVAARCCSRRPVSTGSEIHLLWFRDRIREMLFPDTPSGGPPIFIESCDPRRQDQPRRFGRMRSGRWQGLRR